jgi:NADH-quinone oxidoreductase subunit M
MLSLITFIPLAGALAVALAPERWARWAALAASLAAFVASLGLLAGFDAARAGYQFVESAPWLPQLGIGYKLGVDGVSLWLVLLTTLHLPDRAVVLRLNPSRSASGPTTP